MSGIQINTDGKRYQGTVENHDQCKQNEVNNNDRNRLLKDIGCFLNGSMHLPANAGAYMQSS